MKRNLLLLAGIIIISAMTATAQKKQKEEVMLFEQSQTRILEPQMNLYLKPVVAELDVDSIKTVRDTFGPYEFKMAKPVEELTQAQLDEWKKAALFRATKDCDADILLASLINCYVGDDNPRIMKIEVSGFPAKIQKFKTIATPADIQLITTFYPIVTKARTAVDQ